MSKKNKKDLEIEEGKEFVGKTIVGGRPRKKRKTKLSISVGIEKTLYKAAIDPDFKKLLLEDRMGAIKNQGINLTPSETLIFNNVSDKTLALMINQIQPKKHGKRRFMKAVAAAVVTLATGTAGVGCEDEGPPKDIQEAEEIYEEHMADIGIEPDIPDVPDFTIDEVYEDVMADIGIEPDIPDVSPEEPEEEDAEDVLEDVVEDSEEDAQED